MAVVLVVENFIVSQLSSQGSVGKCVVCLQHCLERCVGLCCCLQLLTRTESERCVTTHCLQSEPLFLCLSRRGFLGTIL